MLARPEPNPFRPGFAEPPLLLAGREEVLTAADESLLIAVHDHRTPRPLFLIGQRGVGKTVILAEVSRRTAEAYGWPRLRVEVTRSTSLHERLIAEAEGLVRLLDQTPSGERFRVDSIALRAHVPGLGGELRMSRPVPAPPGRLAMERSLAALAAAAADRDTGFVLTVDESQAASRPDFGAFAAVLQRGTEERWPMVVVCAGLPTLRQRSSATEPSLGYLERAWWHELGLLDEAATMKALQGPAEQSGRPMNDDAAHLLAAASAGYPYAIQVYGLHAWRAGEAKGRIDLEAAQQALAPAARELDASLYTTRWEQASPREREYLVALATLAAAGTPATHRAVADRLGTSPRALSVYRSRLLTKGTLITEGETMDFALPGMTDYVLRRAHESGASGTMPAQRPEVGEPEPSSPTADPAGVGQLPRPDWGPFRRRPRPDQEGQTER